MFLSGSLVLSTSMLTSYAYLAEGWLINVLTHRLSVATALSAPHQPLYTYYWIVLICTMVMSIGIERARGPLELLQRSGRYLLFSMHQAVSLPLALARYARSVFTGRLEWMKTEHRGLGVPGVPGLPAPEAVASPDPAGQVLAPVGLPRIGGDRGPKAAGPLR